MSGQQNEEKRTGEEPLRTITVGQEWTKLPRQEKWTRPIPEPR